ncbi:Kinase family protein [Quillaja saponaria]|uniref:Kinase family protein n=1 Tax=Quillaja saponaria TaxID=32244 RepID=A0AAD7LF99_QUISA|nr:Kinase family protein [Quillaja saponaria]
MKLGSHQNDLDSYTGQSLDGSFRKFGSGFPQNDLDLSPGHSLDGSFRKSNSVISTYSVSGASATSKSVHTSRRGLKDYGRKLADQEFFTQTIEGWVLDNLNGDSANGELYFNSPFTTDELCKLDLALEGVLFQQLVRMPCSLVVSNDLKEDQYLAIEDFLNAIVIGLWRTFWRKSGQLPLFVSCPRHPGSKFYTVEKAISRGRLSELRGLALISKPGGDVQVRWDQVVVFALFKADISSENKLKVSSRTICEALFYGFHILVSRSLSKTSVVSSNSIFLLVLDSKYGGVVKLSGDIAQLDLHSSNPYQSVAAWIKTYAEVEVTPVHRIWNKLGNANWGDLGTLQALLATFYSIAQWNGPPRKSIASLVSDHSLRLQKRWMECHLENDNMNALVPFQEADNHQGEIVELDHNDDPFLGRQVSHLKLKQGDTLLLDDQQQGNRSFQIQESLVGGNYFLYRAISLDHPSELLTLYVGAHPSRLEPSWEDMSLWYQVQRQTKVLNILRHQGISSRYLPEIISSGRILHSGPCTKESPGGRCDHPWCGTPILVTSPVGEPLSSVIARNGPFSSEDAILCSRDCLAALKSAAMASVQHGDICPENIICVVDIHGSRNRFVHVPISWGRAVLEERDSPAINLQFSSSHALQHGKLCPSSDAESIVYLLFFVCGGTMQQQDSIESALQWREKIWSKRLIQQQLGQVSPLLKAFADYVDSLCGTPYPVDYDIWVKRLTKAIDGSADRGKMVEEAAITLKLEDAAESSGTSGGCP